MIVLIITIFNSSIWNPFDRLGLLMRLHFSFDGESWKGVQGRSDGVHGLWRRRCLVVRIVCSRRNGMIIRLRSCTYCFWLGFVFCQVVVFLFCDNHKFFGGHVCLLSPSTLQEVTTSWLRLRLGALAYSVWSVISFYDLIQYFYWL